MTSKPSINLWLDLWEELVEKGETPDEKRFLDEYCRNAPPEMVEEFRKKLRRLNRMNARVDAAAASDTSTGAAGDTQNPTKTVTPKILQPGFEPVKGYVLISKLGSGGFGQVWKATGPGGHEVALKFVRLERRVGAAEQRALDVMRGVRHPNLLSCHGSWQLGKWLIVAMDLADRTLLDRFNEATATKELPGIPTDELLGYMEEAAKGIDFLNEPRHVGVNEDLIGIQHRDIKPQNLLIQGGGVKVADFGLAKVVEHSVTGHTGSMTPAYSAPESFDNKTSSRSDQYSLAATYCMLRGGRLPFEGSPLEVMLGHREREPDLSMLPVKERPIVGRALAKDPKDRWSSCREFVSALQAVNAGRTLKPPVLKPWRPAFSRSMTRSSRWSDWRILAPVGLISTVVPLVVVMMFATGNRPQPAPAMADLGAIPVPVISMPDVPPVKESMPSRKPEPATDSKVPMLVTATVADVDDNVAKPVPEESVSPESPTDTVMPSPAPAEAPTTQQPEQLVFEPIFDRLNLFGWQEYRTVVESGKPKVNGRFVVRHVPEPGNWKVEGGQLVSDTSSRRPSGFLRTTRSYSDFVLQFSFRVTPKVNSGILIRCPEVSVGHLDDLGMEIQIADDYGLQIRDSSGRTGAINRIAGPSVSLLNPDSQWNMGSIRCEGDLVVVRINGERAVRLDMSEVTALKDRPRSGFIALMTGQGSEVPKGPWFKDIQIAELNDREE